MKPDRNRFDLSLRKDAMLRLPDAASVQIVCRNGTVWITLDHDQRDIVLEAGDRFASTEHRQALITALAASSISVCATPAPAPSLHERNRKQPGLVFEQVLVMDAATRYPVEWIDRFQLARGDWITLRPVLPQDDVLEREFVAHGLTLQSRYLRFLVGLNELPEALAQAFTHVDYHDHFALVAESFADGQQTQVGDARFVRVGGAPEVAEFGIAVADAWNGLGIGRRLLCLFISAARAQGVAQLYGDVLRGNAPMLALAQANGFAVQRHPDNATLVRVQRALTAPITPELIAACE